MASRYLIKETVPFVQFSSVKVTDAYNALFDIEKVPDETLETYCQALFTKAFNQNNSNIPDFLNHHCGLVKEPMHWLNKFEKLISENEEVFHEAKRDSKLMKFQTCIELKRQELKTLLANPNTQKLEKKYINAESEDRYFSFKETKEKTDKLSDYEEKIIFLTKEKFQYQQADIDFVNRNLPEFDVQCQKLIDNTMEIHELEQKFKKTSLEKAAFQMHFNKGKVNCNINQFADVFFQLMNDYFVDGKPYLEIESSDMVHIICNCFTDKEGNEISPDTVRTILYPSRPDKRPKSPKRVDFTKK